MGLRYGIKPDHEPNRCMECGENCRRPKRFCRKHCEVLNEKPMRQFFTDDVYQRGADQVRAERLKRGITPEALEFRRKLSLQRPF